MVIKFRFQKSRERWVTHGDRIYKVLSSSDNYAEKTDKINGLFLSDGTWCTDDSKLQDEAI